ncbi:MAG: oligoendopeptidase F, partial [Rhodoblastus sp.]
MTLGLMTPDFSSTLRHPHASGAAKAEEDLPRWRLDDLYSGLDSPQYAEDLRKVAHECREFAACYRGGLAKLLAGPDAAKALYEAIARYEAIDDLITKIMSFAGLSYAEDTVDPARAKFYGDAQEKITAASTDLLFFQLELNRLDDATLERAIAEAPLSHYRPWLEDLRKEKPFQLEDRIEQLFHE